MVQLRNLSFHFLPHSTSNIVPRSAIRDRDAGFTLIETLIATVVLSAVIYLAMLSYSMFLNIWEKKRLTGISAINSYRSHVLVRSALESIYDYYVTDPADEKIGRHYPFFEGKRNMIEFITLSSVFKKGVPALARLRLESEDRDDGEYYRIIYEETPLDHTYIKYIGIKPKYSNAMIVYTDVKRIKIRYYGEWETKWVPKLDDFKTVYKWQDTFDGQERNTIPEWIELTLDTRTAETTLLFQVKANNAYKRAFFQPVI